MADDYHGFFEKQEFFGNDPHADLEYWGKMACWTIEEATALSYGGNPQVVNWDFLKNCRTCPLATDFERRRELALRAQVMGLLQEQNTPAEFITWAKGTGIPFCPELEGRVRGRGGLTGNPSGAEK